MFVMWGLGFCHQVWLGGRVMRRFALLVVAGVVGVCHDEVSFWR